MVHETKIQTERCILVGVTHSDQTHWQIEEHLDELSSLADTAGATVIDLVIQEREKLDPAYFIGRGKAEELAEIVEDKHIDLLIFDDELSPAQVKNLEQLTDIKVIDRSGLILDIFAAHARSRQARTQVELAQLNYYLPRLTRQWTHLSRQVGGIGTKGPGETQLETDRRLIRTRIAHLKNELSKIERQQDTQRKKAQSLVRIAIVGYTNAGKSTLMNALTGAEAFVQDKLFATLDTTVRRMELSDGLIILLSDTVGFIRKLPHHLIASFKTTLAQTVEADMLLHVVDMSDPRYDEHIRIVHDILQQLGIVEKPTLLVMNKLDLLGDQARIKAAQQLYSEAIFISAKKQIRIERLRTKLSEFVEQRYKSTEFFIPYTNGKLFSRLESLCHILDRQYNDNGIQIWIRYAKENEEYVLSLIDEYKSKS
jgi:GTP-binding protein HflX